MARPLSFVDLSAFSGGLASGMEAAGFHPRMILTASELGSQTIRANRPEWNVVRGAAAGMDASSFDGVDLVSATVRELPGDADGTPGHPLGDVLAVVESVNPAAVLVSASPELAAPRFALYRERVVRQLGDLGFQAGWQQFELPWFGIPQRRRVFVLVAGDPSRFTGFSWPARVGGDVSLGRYLYPQMAENGWPGALFWASRSGGIGPAIMPDVDQDEPNLGSAFSTVEWHTLAIDGYAIAQSAPGADFAPEQNPQLTMEMIAHLQGFDRDWRFVGSPAEQLRQIAGDFPPLVAESIGRSVAASLQAGAVAQPVFGARTVNSAESVSHAAG